MTRRGDPCARVADAILDEALPRPVELDDHLALCPDCRLLAAAHRAALDLAGAVADTPTPVDPAAVARIGRRRAAIRGAIASAAAAGAVALTIGVRGPAPAERGPTLVDLSAEVRAITRRAVSEDDATYRPFGPLAVWMRPPRSRALDVRPFDEARLDFDAPRPFDFAQDRFRSGQAAPEVVQ